MAHRSVVNSSDRVRRERELGSDETRHLLLAEGDARIAHGDRVVRTVLAEISAHKSEFCWRLTVMRAELLQLLPQSTHPVVARRARRRSHPPRHRRLRTTVTHYRAIPSAPNAAFTKHYVATVAQARILELRALVDETLCFSDHVARRLGAAAVRPPGSGQVT